jgi:hypothetical protein
MSQDHPVAIGDRVFHQKYGDGTVTGFYGEKHASVMFDRVGVKRVVPASLESIQPVRAAPAAPVSAEIVPFPIARCPALVRSIVNGGVDKDYLARHQDRLVALGVDSALAEADTNELANAMRSYWMQQYGARRKATA